MKTRTLGWVPGRRASALYMTAVAVLLFLAASPGALAETTMTMERTVIGLQDDLWLIPGTTTLDITITLTLGGDMEEVKSLGLTETLPAGWSFEGTMQGLSIPAIPPAVGATGTLNFVWINPFPPSSFPFKLTYRVNVPAGELGPVDIVGQAEFRATGGALFSNEVTTPITIEPTTITVAREFAGTAGPGGAFYAPDSQIDVTLNFDRTTGIADLLGFVFEDTLPAGWSYVGDSFSGAPTPDMVPGDGATGTLTFIWLSDIPTFPFSFTYSIAVPALAEGEACLDGVARYSITGVEEQSNALHDCLNLLPCISMTHTAPPSYGGMSQFDVTLQVESTCTTAVSAFGITENLPPGLSFISADPAPPVPPAVGATGTLEFVWITVPAFPFTFTYTVAVEAGLEDALEICGQVLYRLDMGELRSPETCASLTYTPIPVITLLGADPATVECRDIYTDAGATAFSLRDGDLTDEIVVNNPVNTSIPGTYVVTYNVTDSLGQSAVEVTRTVYVVDTQAPVITLVGNAFATVQCGSVFLDPGATAADTCDGNLTAAIQAVSTVNPSSPGTYSITYSVSDGAGHAAVPVVRTVAVVDTANPTITLLGASPATVQCGAAYIDAGATATDVCHGNLTGSIIVDASAVNPSVPGTYTVQYSVTDPSGNTATRPRQVLVVDTTAPTLTLLGANPLALQCGSLYQDPGGTGDDSCDSSVTITVDSSGVNMSEPGTYTAFVTAHDDAGNTNTLPRTVIVSDNIAPAITLVGAASVNVECGTPYTDAGATATDACDGNLTSQITTVNPVNPNVPGNYVVTYRVSDSTGNETTAIRNVAVVDTRAATITLIGSAQITVECGGNYTDAGATAADACEGNLTNQIITTGLPIDTAETGQYTVTYRVTDSQGHVAQASRIVSVEDTVRPVITLVGSANVTVECGAGYQDAGATALDTCWGDLSASVTSGGDVVDTGTRGNYQIIYTVSDGAGNTALPVIRTVTVTDTQAPVITLLGTNPYTIACNQDYVDPGVEAVDSCDMSLSPVTADESMVDTTGEGEYQVHYAVADAAGNEGTATRIVIVEGPCEGEGEGEAPCELNEVIIIEPAGDLLVPAGVRAAVGLRSRISFADPANCQGARVEMVYEIDGVPVASSQDRANDFPAVVDLLPGHYTVNAIATDLEGGSAAADYVQFQVRVGTDNNGNGYLDNPFAELVQDGDRWDCVVSGGESPRAVAMRTWFGACEGQDDGTFNVTVFAPGDPTQAVTIAVPRALLDCGEQGILLVTVADTMNALLGPASAALLPPPPIAPPAGAIPFEVTIIVSQDNGATFAEVDNALLAILPIRVAENGLGFTPSREKTFFSYPTAVVSVPATGIEVELEEGVWNRDAIQNVAVQGSTLSADVTALSLFLPIELPNTGPVLSVSPDPKYPFVVGIVPVGESAEAVLTVRNVGGGTLTGAATLTDPNNVFVIFGGAYYILGSSMTAEIVIRFAPPAAGEYTATLTLTDAAGAPVTVTLKGAGTTSPKPVTVFGCHGGTGSHTTAGDALALAATAAMLFIFSRRQERRN